MHLTRRVELSIRDKAMVLLAGSTGLRRSELIALTWGDVNEATLEVSIQRSCVAPVVTVELSALAGGVESPVEYPGLAHAQEHMAFRGCAGMTSDQTAAIYTQLGGQKDADTDKNCNAVGGLMNVWVITARTSVGYVALRKNGFSGGPANTAAPAVSVGSIALASDVSLLQLVPTSTVPNQMCEK